MSSRSHRVAADEDGEPPEDTAESARPRGPPPPESAAGIPRSHGFAHQLRSLGRCATRCGLLDSRPSSTEHGDHYCLAEAGHWGPCVFLPRCGRSLDL